MLYWSGSGATVHVLDGSSQKIHAHKLHAIDSNIHYHYMKLSIRNRLKIALSLVDTEYVALLGDDEFFLQAGASACIEELEKDKELVSCMGRTVGFNQTEEGIVGFPCYSEQKHQNINSDCSITRMVQHTRDYSPSTIYSIVRADVWKTSMLPYTTEKEFNVYAIGELQFELLTVFQGKTKVISDLLWLRSWENEQIRNTKEDPALNTRNKFIDWWEDSNKEEEKQFFIGILERVLFSSNTLQNKKITAGISEASDQYCIFYENKNQTSRLLGLRKLLPSFIKDLIKRVSNKTTDNNLIEFIQALHKSEGVQFDEKEILSIYNILTRFHDVEHEA